jgi:succinate-acetate transporter protein
MASTFTFLVIGFILLDLAHFGFPSLKVPAAVVLIACALNTWYMLAHVIFLQVFGMDILPVGKPRIQPKPKDAVGQMAEAVF